MGKNILFFLFRYCRPLKERTLVLKAAAKDLYLYSCVGQQSDAL